MESVDTVMVIGGGGRGQALAKKLASEGLEMVVSPGSPGNEDFAHSTEVEATDIQGQLEAAKHYGADLTIVGPEDSLERNIAAAWRAARTFSRFRGEIFAPYANQTMIESDRAFAKRFAIERGIPVGAYYEFTDKREALEYAATDRQWPLYVKDNGLKQGKGAHPCANMEEFEAAIKDMEHFVVEDNVSGLDISHHAFCDGKTHLSIPFVVRDHKQIGADDTGPMTGGMGVVGPLPDYTPKDVEALGDKFVAPVVEGLGFQGMLFSGLKGAKGEELSLEWNARFGDPETQVFMRLMKSDLLPAIMACVECDLASLPSLEWDLGKYATCLVLAAPGYPAAPEKGLVVEGLEDAAKLDGVEVLQAGTKQQDGALRTDGGRVINLVTSADSLEESVNQAYKAAEKITFDGQPPLMRPDIGASTMAAIS